MEQERMRFGIEEFDKILSGGVPFGSNILLKNTTGTPKDALLRRYALEGLGGGYPCWIMSTTGYGKELFTGNEIEDYKGEIIFIDAFSNAYNRKDVKPQSKYSVRNISDIKSIEKSIRDATFDMPTNRSRGIIDSFSYILGIAETNSRIFADDNLSVLDIMSNLQNQKALLREHDASIIYTVNPESHSKQLLSSLEDLFDCVIFLNKTNGKRPTNTLRVEKLNHSDYEAKEHIISVSGGNIEIRETGMMGWLKNRFGR